MSDLPVPGPVDDDDYDNYDNCDPDADAWESALDWARKGDLLPLAECLRFNPSAPPDQMAVRNFLADVLDETYKKPRNSKAKRDQEFVPFVDIDGRQLRIDKRYLPQAEAIKRVREVMRDKKCSQAIAIEDVVKELGTKDELKLAKYRDKIAGYLQNPRPQWGLSGRTVEEMFSGVAKLKE
jgi:hypothetical protein